eukprot:jgi/Mesvir1/7967/Mv11877-RA.1
MARRVPLLLCQSLVRAARAGFNPAAVHVPTFHNSPSCTAAAVATCRAFPFSSLAEPAGTTAGAQELTKAVTGVRCAAIIAHVDHGKTTLMDRLLTQCSGAAVTERCMDSSAQEQERGITITSKYTSLQWKGVTLNIVDTPGHADFGGEVERVLDMVDGTVLLVDALEGPLAQTKFVLAKALQRNIRPIVVLNKVDRDTVTKERCEQSESDIFDLFASLGATDEQLDFPVLYASARQGWASRTFTKQGESMAPLLDTILAHVPPPRAPADPSAPFSMLVSMLEKDNFFGRIATGSVRSGSVQVGDQVVVMARDFGAPGGPATLKEKAKVTKVFTRRAMQRIELPSASAGDIVSIAGLSLASVTDTVASPTVERPLPSSPIDPPTISMAFSVNSSPLAGREGRQLNGSKIGERLMAEAETNVSIRVEPTPDKDSYIVQGRGELQLGVLLETMRREGFELSVSPPKVLFREGEGGQKLEPVEEVMVEVEDQYTGVVIQGMSDRRAELVNMIADPHSGRTRLNFLAPSRGLLGYRSVFNTDTHGTGLMHRAFHAFEPMRGPLDNVRKGVLVSMASGTSTTYALATLEARGTLFIGPGQEVYEGMIIGEHSRENDLDVNPVKAKQVTNMRSAGAEDIVQLTPPRLIPLEAAIGYVRPDELIEITPKSIRLRKRVLDTGVRKSQTRGGTQKE